MGEYISPITKPETPKKFVSGQYFLPPYSGILASLSLPEKVENGEVAFFKRVGDAEVAERVADARWHPEYPIYEPI